MTSLLVILSSSLTILPFVFYSNSALSIQRSKETSTDKTTNELLWQRRINAVWNMIKTVPCKKLQYGDDCSTLRQKRRDEMLLYTASASGQDKQLVTVLVEKVKGKIRGHDAVIVVDPYPEAHFGHTVVVFLSKFQVSKHYCNRKQGSYLQDGRHKECIYIGQSESCRNRIGHGRKGRRRCEINFLPLVYEEGDSTYTQRLQCRSNYFMFGKCPFVVTSENDRCSNSGRCSSSKAIGYRGFRWLCLEKCDHAVLISGGWNSLMNKPRHLENLKSTWKYLKSKGFLERNMKVFFANNGTVDIDSNKKTRDTVPATESSGILKYVEAVCKMGPHCVDRLVIYLNGPTLMNGNLLLWDRNGDGIADGTEMLRVRDILNKLDKCNVSWINIIADQNYAGHLVETIRQRHLREPMDSSFHKISVFAASNKRSYTWRNDFTKKWIELDSKWIERDLKGESRQMNKVFQDVKQTLPNYFTFSDFSAPGGELQTVSGKIGDEIGCTLNQPWDISSQLFRFPRGAAQFPPGTSAKALFNRGDQVDSTESSKMSKDKVATEDTTET